MKPGILNLLMFLITGLPFSGSIGNGEPSVVIIGAGYAGLGAADRLINYNGFKDVVILEALGRPGGCVNTISVEEGKFDMGAQYIHSLQSETYKLLKEQDNILMDEKRRRRKKRSRRKRQSDDGLLYDKSTAILPGGKRLPDHVIKKYNELNLVFQGLLDEIDVPGQYGVRPANPGWKSVKAYLNDSLPKLWESARNGAKTEKERKDFDEYEALLGPFIEYWAKWDYSFRDLNNTSILNYLWEDVYPDEQYYEYSLGTLGYFGVTETFINRLPKGTIRYNSNVTKIDWRKEKPVVTTADGMAYKADHVIVTSSVGYLKAAKNTLFSPPLPKIQSQYIDSLETGCMEKVFMFYEKRWWSDDIDVVFLFNSDNQNTTVPFTTMEELKQNMLLISTMPKEVHANVLEVWLPYPQNEIFVGVSDEDIMKAFTERLQDYRFADQVEEPYKILRSNWCNDPMFLNAYGIVYTLEYDATGFTQKDIREPIYCEVEPGVKKPVLQFAGEATANFVQTAHGAYDSGIRVAKKIAEFYEKETYFKGRLR